MKKGKDNGAIVCSHERLRATRKNAKKTRRQWLGQLVCALAVVFAVPWVDAGEINANMAGIPVGPGQVCIKYFTSYASLADWSGGTPVELIHYKYISYDAVEYSQTVHSCVGGRPLSPGPLPEGNFFLVRGIQMAIVNIERIQDECPYMLTYYHLKNPVSIPDPDGICVKGKPAPINTPSPDPGNPECPQLPLN
ncbi:MAG: hypothetical protein ACD_74C00265G0003 [uncultured bacterium]|nr:MAG: hypothetical protein ACD_74C00265G0003 [uncultured bacterium]